MSFGKDLPPNSKYLRPIVRADAVAQIEETFAANDWIKREAGDFGDQQQQLFISELGLTGDWKQFSNENLRRILNLFEKERMILYAN